MPPASAIMPASASINVSAGANGTNERRRVHQETVAQSYTREIAAHGCIDGCACDELCAACIACKVIEQRANAALNIAARVLINWFVVNLLVVATVMVISLDPALASKIVGNG